MVRGQARPHWRRFLRGSRTGCVQRKRDAVAGPASARDDRLGWRPNGGGGVGVVVAGLSHRTAPIEIREKCTFTARDAAAVLEALRDVSGTREGVLLSTCNRTEFYLVEGAVDAPPGVWEMLSARLGTDAVPFGYVRRDRDAVRHLMRVTPGLDSMVVGEAQIKGQVRDAWELCRPYSGPVLNRLFQTAQS